MSTAAVVACLALTAWFAPAAAQEFPTRPIKFVVPFPPGSGTDATARYYANELSKLTSHPVVVENKPGGSGFIAASSVLNGPADGHTVLIGSTSTLATNVALFRTLPYDPVKDFAPLSMLMGSTVILLVPQNSPHKGITDLINDAQKRPGALNYAAGAASYQLMSEWFNEMAHIKTTHVPYKGAPDAARAVMSGEVDFTLVDTTTGLSALQGGKVRALAVASNQRLKNLPEVPTAVESGLRDFITYTWVGAAVPANTPQPVAAKLTAWIAQIAERPRTREFLEKTGMEVMPIGPAEFRKFQQENIVLWKRVAQSANIEPQ
ncbi:ABC transporter substrate-binding protein [Noviherbaspirillum sp. Root189]|nr:ABC transporter substrate-binding protein [Noviherbaspirillum sp. Root189]